MKTRVATVSQRPLWEGNLPPIAEGSRLVIGPPGSTEWIVDRAFIHLNGKATLQVLYVEEAGVHEPGPRDAFRAATRPR